MNNEIQSSEQWGKGLFCEKCPGLIWFVNQKQSQMFLRGHFILSQICGALVMINQKQAEPFQTPFWSFLRLQFASLGSL